MDIFGDLEKIVKGTETKQCNIGIVIASKLCKYCNKEIPKNDKPAKYGDGTLGCSECERKIDKADMNPWKNDNSYCL